MKSELIHELTDAISSHGFTKVNDPLKSLPEVAALLKLQTWNINRAIVVVQLATTPGDLSVYLKTLRRKVAFHCRFVPFFWDIGIQVVLIAPGLAQGKVDPIKHVDKINNQWAIIQSIFLCDPATQLFLEGRTWGQFITGKFQDTISNTLAKHFTLAPK